MLILLWILAPWNLKKKPITPPIPEHAHKRGECSGIGGVGDLFSLQQAKIHDLKSISTSYY